MMLNSSGVTRQSHSMSKRAFMRVTLASPLSDSELDVRTFESTDELALGDLLYRAYLDTMDYKGETPDQAADEVRKTIQSQYGRFMPSCSKIVERAGSLLSATLITRFQERPFVASVRFSHKLERTN